MTEKRSITGFYLDENKDWVAELECGHTRHVRHDPPWQEREWVTTPEGRESMLGFTFACRDCDAGMIKYPAETTDDVIENLERIIGRAKKEASPMGYFPVLYHRVTVSVKESISRGEFDDNSLMEKLDVNFANRYFDAWISWTENRPPTQSWYVSFETAGRTSPVVLQHLLLGVHAHINFDLGIAAVQTAGGPSFGRLKSDFDRINAILSTHLDQVKTNMGAINMLLKVLYPLIDRFDEFLADFSIRFAREGAWKFAERLNTAAPGDMQHLIAERDQRIAELARCLADPGKRLTYILAVARLGEWRNVGWKLDALGRKALK